jgi:hypothetical protein
VKDNAGHKFLTAIKAGLEHPDQGVDFCAGSMDSYVKFAPLVDLMIEDLHGVSKEKKHTTDWSLDEDLQFSIEEQTLIKSIRFRVSRNLEQFSFNTTISKEDRI